VTISAGAGSQTITEHELAQAELFEENGYVALTPGGRTTPTPSRTPRPIVKRFTGER